MTRQKGGKGGKGWKLFGFLLRESVSGGQCHDDVESGVGTVKIHGISHCIARM